MSIVLMGLGPIRFSVPGINYQQLNRRFEYRWVPQMRIGSRPAQQYLGPGEEGLRIHGILYPHNRLGGGYGELNSLRAAAMSGVPMGLASAKGIYFGPWCVALITDEQEYFHPNGDPRRVEFEIELVAYGI
jgi:phage protein U